MIIVVGLEDYLHGVDEMPLSWHPEALEAQVIASRSYAVYQGLGRGPESAFTTKVLSSGQTVAQACWCHVYDSTADQNYDGWSAESDPTYGAKWRTAIAATAGKIVTHPNSAFTRDGIALTVFSSSSGGVTESNVSGFGSATLFPYLDTVPDAWSLDPFNPYASWTATRSPGALAAAVGLGGPADTRTVTAATVTSRHPSGSVAQVRFDGIVNGSPMQKVMTGLQAKAALGLKSVAFNICVDPGVCPYGGPPDADYDGVPDGVDNCPLSWNPNQSDVDGDGIGDVCDPIDDDPDRDGVLTAVDNCSGVYNPDQADSDGNGLGDMCDPWDDVSIEHWARESIQAIYDAGISNGCHAGPLRFCPEDDVSRAEMAAFLLRASDNLPTGSFTGVFDDVPGEAWYALDVEHMYAEGFTAGCASGPLRYCPLASTTRAEVAVFLVRVLGMESQLGTGAGSFSDVDTEAWYADAVELLGDPSVGILNGYPDGTYRPENPMTRAEMASLLDRTFLDS